MAAILSTSTTCSGDFEPGGFTITNCIKIDTTPEAFDAECRKIPEYRLTHGGRCGWNALGQAAFLGNVRLCEHIVKVGGKSLLSLGNRNGNPPLSCASEGKQYHAAEKVLQLGASVNLNGGNLQTPLRMACGVNSVALTKLLLSYGGTISEHLPKPVSKSDETDSEAASEIEESDSETDSDVTETSSEADRTDSEGTDIFRQTDQAWRLILDQARNEMRAEKGQLTEAVRTSTGSYLPAELDDLITSYVPFIEPPEPKIEMAPVEQPPVEPEPSKGTSCCNLM